MTNKETIEILNKLKSYFDSPLFENNHSVINALEVAVESIENKENSKKLDRRIEPIIGQINTSNS